VSGISGAAATSWEVGGRRASESNTTRRGWCGASAASPSGRAVSREAGAAYKERLFALPGFLLGSQNATPDAADVAAGLRLTGHFLLERVLAAHGKQMPQARLRLDGLASRESA